MRSTICYTGYTYQQVVPHFVFYYYYYSMSGISFDNFNICNVIQCQLYICIWIKCWWFLIAINFFMRPFLRFLLSQVYFSWAQLLSHHYAILLKVLYCKIYLRNSDLNIQEHLCLENPTNLGFNPNSITHHLVKWD